MKTQGAVGWCMKMIAMRVWAGVEAGLGNLRGDNMRKSCTGFENGSA